MKKTEPTLEYVDPSTLTPWVINPRINRQAVDRVASSLRLFGFGRPLVAWQRSGARRLVVGHTTLLAYQQILSDSPGWQCVGAEEGRLPVRWRNDWTEAEASAYALADNRLGEISQWDPESLSEVLHGLEEEMDLTVLGWTDQELDLLLAEPESLDPFKEIDASVDADTGGTGRDIRCPHCGELFRK